MNPKFKELYQNWYNKNFIPLDKYCEIWLKIGNDYEKEDGFNGKVSQTEND